MEWTILAFPQHYVVRVNLEMDVLPGFMADSTCGNT